MLIVLSNPTITKNNDSEAIIEVDAENVHQGSSGDVVLSTQRIELRIRFARETFDSPVLVSINKK